MIEFRPLAVDDLPLLSKWVNRPHVAEWWDGATSLAAVRAKFRRVGLVETPDGPALLMVIDTEGRDAAASPEL